MNSIEELKELYESHRNQLSHYYIDPDVEVSADTIMGALFHEIEHLENKYEKSGQECNSVSKWWKAATWRFIMHHSKTIEEAEEKLQVFEKDYMMGKEEGEAFKEALKEK